jgi:hypothetical protein
MGSRIDVPPGGIRISRTVDRVVEQREFLVPRNLARDVVSREVIKREIFADALRRIQSTCNTRFILSIGKEKKAEYACSSPASPNFWLAPHREKSLRVETISWFLMFKIA